MDAAALGLRRTPGQSAVARTGARAVAAPACVTALVLAVVAGAYAHGGSDGSDHPAVVAPPGYAPAAFTAPPAGTYTLPVLGAAADGTVLDELGRTRRLHELFDGRLVLLSFIYTHCADADGCPLASYVLGQVQDRIAALPELRDRVRLLSLSFDPGRDTPAVMAAYARAYRRAGDWQFLTGASARALAPILAAYGQSLVNDVGPDGASLGSISHILRVFLIDDARRIRNIYSTSFLHVDTLVNDVRTVLFADTEAARTVPERSSARVDGAGDDKRGYEQDSYRTRSQALGHRRGRAADLGAALTRPPAGLPPLTAPDDNPPTAARIALGRRLFYDRRLSHNDTISCAMCHIPEQGFTSNELSTAIGIEGRSVRRNAPTLYNVGYRTRLFHDGRERRLEQQIWGPLLAANEMGNPAVGYLLDKIAALADYAELFAAAFDGAGPSMATVGAAIASYERTLVSGGSPFDRWYYGKDEAAMPAAARRGYDVFTGKGGCSACHLIGPDYALFTDDDLHNTGIGYARSMGANTTDRRVLVAPGTWLTLDPQVVAAATSPVPADLGAYEITLDPADRWRYRTPSLRNVALTAPYMHDGSITTLRAVIEFYDRGGVANELLDPRIRALGLTAQEKDDLVAFLENLTGDNIDTLVADAFAAPVGDRD
ncbi:MAG: SCO family protein [Gammaproteobacteria bacterium]|nr:SCO family protein [Gammaproteobacteria bacterium]